MLNIRAGQTLATRCGLVFARRHYEPDRHEDTHGANSDGPHVVEVAFRDTGRANSWNARRCVPKSYHDGSEAAGLSRIRVLLGRSRAETGRNRPNSGRMCPNLVTTSTNISQLGPGSEAQLGQTRRSLAQLRRNLSRTRPNLLRNRTNPANICPESTNMARNRPSLGFDQIWPECDKVARTR